jgi:predicted alpha-1,2-mannosidase
MKLMGGKKTFVQNLQKVFDEDLYDMSNEPDITYPYLFNYVKGEEWRTQKKVNELIKTYFKNEPAGLPGNDDTGTMSTWLVFSMMGIYPHCPGDMTYALTAPVFDKIEITLNTKYYPNDRLVIEKSKAIDDAIYIDRILLGDKRLKDFFVDHHELLKAGKLVFYTKDRH